MGSSLQLELPLGGKPGGGGSEDGDGFQYIFLVFFL